MKRCQEKAPILRNTPLRGCYFRVDLEAPAIAPLARPGQFVHVRLPDLEHRLLRRPFSVFDAEPAAGTLSLLYKTVGEGTHHLARLGPGTWLDLLGPLGNGFGDVPAGATPVIAAGGYGSAATYLLARRSPAPGIVCLGGRTEQDLLLVPEYRALGWDVRLVTEDGRCGRRGLVTDLLQEALDQVREPFVAACGPNSMLRAVCEIVRARGIEAQVSLDPLMCCGVGACFTCVVKTRADTPAGWEYTRACSAGPVFPASVIVWD